MKTKRCTLCNKIKSLLDFGLDKKQKDKHNRWCKLCANKKGKESYYGLSDDKKEVRKKKANIRARKYYQENKEKCKKASVIVNRKRRTGFTRELYDSRYEQQKGRCAICNRHQSVLERALAGDHNHRTKKCRGLLCSVCNTELGRYEKFLYEKELFVKFDKYRDIYA